MIHFDDPPDWKLAHTHLTAIAEVQRLMGPFDRLALTASWDPQHGWGEAVVTIHIGNAEDPLLFHFRFGPGICTDYLICSHAALGEACSRWLNPTLLDAS